MARQGAAVRLPASGGPPVGRLALRLPARGAPWLRAVGLGAGGARLRIQFAQHPLPRGGPRGQGDVHRHAARHPCGGARGLPPQPVARSGPGVRVHCGQPRGEPLADDVLPRVPRRGIRDRRDGAARALRCDPAGVGDRRSTAGVGRPGGGAQCGAHRAHPRLHAPHHAGRGPALADRWGGGRRVRPRQGLHPPILHGPRRILEHPRPGRQGRQ